MFKQLKKNQSGFTLVEIVISMAIFTTAVTTLSNIFLYANRAQRKTQAIQESQSDARFALAVISQQVRRGNIDYSYYGGTIASNPQSVLALLDMNNNKILFRKITDGSRGVLEISQDGGVVWSPLTPPSVSVSTVLFYISPTTNPFASNPSSDTQPLVTIILSTTSTTGEGLTLRPTIVQTSISSRQYLR